MSTALLHRFYTAFQARDGAGMSACYHPEARFSDPVFQGLTADEPGAMWRMLCHRGKDLVVAFSDVVGDADSGSAHWDATYTFSATGRQVENHIDASFRFRDGLIVEHTDVFDLYAWTRMALGPTGFFLGWTPLLQNKVRAQAKAGLVQWMAREAAR